MLDTLTLPNQTVTQTDAMLSACEVELGKFFQIASRRMAAGLGKNYMPGGLIDEVWHTMLKDADRYATFSKAHAGHVLGHAENAGFGTLAWVADYEAKFGTLDKVWFADKSGQIDSASFDEYQRTGQYVTSWDCTPDSGEQDFDDDGSGITA